VTVTVRPLEPNDAPALVRLVVANRAFLAPYEPIRPDSFYSVAGQLERLARLAEDRLADRGYSGGILADGELVGTVTLAPIVRGAAQCATVGYWVAESSCGRGVATAAVRETTRMAFAELALHRVDSCTLVDNIASQRVLAKVGFEQVGRAPRYLRVDGEWRDHLLFQLLAD
jgi:ribosomal-protein-alanine N-acetyltransferase